jgi:hypothetical protein
MVDLQESKKDSLSECERCDEGTPLPRAHILCVSQPLGQEAAYQSMKTFEDRKSTFEVLHAVAVELQQHANYKYKIRWNIISIRNNCLARTIRVV